MKTIDPLLYKEKRVLISVAHKHTKEFSNPLVAYSLKATDLGVLYTSRPT